MLLYHIILKMVEGKFFFYYWLFRVNYKKLIDSNILNKNNFSDIEKVLRNKNFIRSISLLLKSIANIHNCKLECNTKKILSCIMMYRFPDMINYYPERDDISKKLYKKCEILIKLLSNLDNSLVRLKLILEIPCYLELFDKFKDKDRLDMIESLILTLFELEESYKNKSGSYDEDTLKCIKCEIDKTNKRIEQFNGSELLKKYRKRESEIEESIKTNITKAFWDSYENELNKTPPNLSVVLPLIEDTLNLVNKCVPNNKKFTDELSENIDKDYLKYSIESNITSTTDIRRTIIIIIEAIEKLQSASKDDSLNKWKNDLLHTLKDDNYNIGDFLINFFKEAFNRLDEIYNEKIEFNQYYNIS